MNTKFSYLYRDNDNFKQMNTVILKGILTKQQIADIRAASHNGDFVPNAIGLPEIRLGDYDESRDNPWFELTESSFEEIPERDNYIYDVPMSAKEFYDRFIAMKDKWEAVAEGTDTEEFALTSAMWLNGPLCRAIVSTVEPDPEEYEGLPSIRERAEALLEQHGIELTYLYHANPRRIGAPDADQLVKNGFDIPTSCDIMVFATRENNPCIEATMKEILGTDDVAWLFWDMAGFCG